MTTLAERIYAQYLAANGATGDKARVHRRTAGRVEMYRAWRRVTGQDRDAKRVGRSEGYPKNQAHHQEATAAGIPPAAPCPGTTPRAITSSALAVAACPGKHPGSDRPGNEVTRTVDICAQGVHTKALK